MCISTGNIKCYDRSSSSCSYCGAMRICFDTCMFVLVLDWIEFFHADEILDATHLLAQAPVIFLIHMLYAKYNAPIMNGILSYPLFWDLSRISRSTSRSLNFNLVLSHTYKYHYQLHTLYAVRSSPHKDLQSVFRDFVGMPISKIIQEITHTSWRRSRSVFKFHPTSENIVG